MAVPEPPAPGLALYYLVMYVKGPAWSPESNDRTAATQVRHLEHLRRLQEQGIRKFGGPFEMPHDSRWRGMSIVKADSAEQVRDLYNGDPAVQSGRLSFEISSVWLAVDSVER